MQVFTYPWFWKFIYRYGNIVLSPLLLLYTFPMVLILDKNLIFILPFALSLFLLYYINKSYFNFYKLVPNKIETDGDTLVCSEFLFRDKKITIKIKDIESLSGGIFDGRYRGLMKICDGKNKICVGFFDRMKDSGKLTAIILSKVDKKIYDSVIDKIQSIKIRPETNKK